MEIRRRLMMMGVNDVEKWVLVNTITSGDSDVSVLSCNADSNGNPIKLKAVAVIIYSAVSQQVTGNVSIKIGVTPDVVSQSSSYEIITISAGIRTTAQQNLAWARVMGVIPDKRNDVQTPAENSTTTLFVGGTTDGIFGKGAVSTNSSNDGYIHQVYASGKYFGPGSFMRVYGVKA